MSRLKETKHIPVLVNEISVGLHIQKGKKYIDATVGEGGHALEIIKKGGKLLALDTDPASVTRAKRRIEDSCRKEFETGILSQPIIVTGNFRSISEIAKKFAFEKVAGILFDLGVSSVQLETDMGLSFAKDAPLDMRLDPKLTLTAADLVNTSSQEELYEIFTRNAQEELAWPISQAIVIARRLKTIRTTGDLVAVINTVVRGKKARLHPATKVFLALRIEVNDEITALKQGITQAIGLLVKQGRMAIVSFHETEDRIVKQLFKKAQQENKLLILTKKPITPTTEEIQLNPRARSAKLRLAKRT